MNRWTIALLVALIAGPAWAQDPQAVLDGLIRRHQETDAARRHNERLRLELERRDLEDQLRYPRDRSLIETKRPGIECTTVFYRGIGATDCD